MKYEIRPIDKDRWHGYSGSENDFGRGVSFNALIDGKTGKYAISIPEDRLQKLQELTGYNLDTRTLPSGQPHPFYDDAISRVKLPNHSVFFNATNPKEEILIGIIKAVPMVANSLREWEEGHFPEATHYIFSEDEETSAKEAKIARLDEARSLKIAMSKEQKVAIVRILSGRDVASKSDNFVNVAVEEALTKDADAFLHYAEMDNEIMSAHYLIHKCLDKGILLKDGPSIIYGTDRLGYNFQEAVTFLTDPKNQPIRLRLMEMSS